jgi:hypothetical protein
MPICYEIYYKISSTVAEDIFVPKHVLLYVYNIVHLVGCHK